MTLKDKIAYKGKLLQNCIDIIKNRIEVTQLAIQNAQSAANSEEKSSAGDKYETSRAMSHLEKDMHSKQLVATRQELEHLMETDCTVLYNVGAKGSLVQCEKAAFFIAAGIGKIVFEEKEVYIISPAAPLAKILLNKKAGEQIIFNKTSIDIVDIY
ncbi:MAG: hypothetical protein ABJB11_07665 [Ferruginibacter sp.]